MIQPEQRHRLKYEETREACAKRVFYNIVGYIAKTDCNTFYQFSIVYDFVVSWEKHYSDFREMNKQLVLLRYWAYQGLIYNHYKLCQKPK